MSKQQLREAFDQITPSDEAKQRMLSGILAAAEKAPVELVAVEPTVIEPVTPKQIVAQPTTSKQVLLKIEPRTPRKPHKPRRPSRLLAFSLPIACGLIILATMGALIVPQLLSAPPTSVSEAPQTSSPAPPSSASPDGASVDEPTIDVSALMPADDSESSALAPPSSSPSPSLSPGKIISVVIAIALPVLTAALLGGYALLKRRKARKARAKGSAKQ